MMTWARVLFLMVACQAVTASGAELLDREAVLRIAREQTVSVQVARVQEDVADGEVRAARTWRFNPELELSGGPRRGAHSETWDRSIGVSQKLDLAGRSARIEAAGVSRDATSSESRYTELSIVARASGLHLKAIHAAQLIRLAAEAAAVHDRLLEIAQRRFEAGETGRIDVHQATVAATRVRMRLAVAEADEQNILAELTSLLALEPARSIEIEGELEWPVPGEISAIREAVASHPQITSLEARSRTSSAEIRLAGAARWPEIGLGASFGREEEADIMRFGVQLGLPVFARGQGQRDIAAASHRIDVLQLEAAKRSRLDQALRAWERYQDLQRALDTADRTTTEALAATGRLAEKSYQLGEISLDRVFLFEREILDAKNEMIDLRLAVAMAALQVAEIAALPPLLESQEVPR